FQAEDGIRDDLVTGVQTCALPISVRTPTRFDTDTEVTFPGVRLLGNPNFKSEAVVAFESGYRSRIARRLSMDVATFFNIYDNLQIGRASCRERVKIYVVGVCLQHQ